MMFPNSKFNHLSSMIGPYGVFEHAKHDRVRHEHGYCVDDVARVLLVVAREQEKSTEVDVLSNISLSFLKEAQCSDGTFMNRRSPTGAFLGSGSNADCWGRAVWSLGNAVAQDSDGFLAQESMGLLATSLNVRSPWPRSMAFATLGAAEVLSVFPTHRAAQELVRDAARLLRRPNLNHEWQWPEERLTYANAVLPEAMLAAGAVLADDSLVHETLVQLRWLVATETNGNHLSVTSSKGHRRGSRYEMFDQQPIEVAALCDACARALDLTGSYEWSRAMELAVQWFLGNNDLGEMMFNPLTGGGYDGLTANGPNMNQGAESTLALLSTLQRAQLLEMAP